MPKEFEIIFELSVYRTGIVRENILHLTTGENCCSVGEMIPAVWMINGNLEVGMGINGVGNTSKLVAMNGNAWHKVKISQMKNLDDDFIFQVVIDDIVKWSVTNKQPKEFKDVKVFVSNPWQPEFKGSLRSFRICFNGMLKRLKHYCI